MSEYKGHRPTAEEIAAGHRPLHQDSLKVWAKKLRSIRLKNPFRRTPRHVIGKRYGVNPVKMEEDWEINSLRAKSRSLKKAGSSGRSR